VAFEEHDGGWLGVVRGAHCDSRRSALAERRNPDPSHQAVAAVPNH
jgi:hypothetical protein